MHIQFISRPSRNLLERERLFVAVMKQWDGKKLEISIFMMGMNKTRVDFIRLESAKIQSDLRPRRCEVKLGVNFFYIKPFLKELSFFWVVGFFMVGQLDHKILVSLSLFRSLLNLNESRLGLPEQTNRCIRGTRSDSC